MSIGPIPFEAIDRWAARYHITGDAFEELMHLIRAADHAYLEYWRERQQAGKKSNARG